MTSQSNAAGGSPEEPRFVTLNSPGTDLQHQPDVREGRDRLDRTSKGGRFLWAGVLYEDPTHLDPTLQPAGTARSTSPASR